MTRKKRFEIKENAKFTIICAYSRGMFEVKHVYDERTHKYRNELIKERGLAGKMNERDLKQTLNWNLGGNDDMFLIERETQKGCNVYICD